MNEHPRKTGNSFDSEWFIPTVSLMTIHLGRLLCPLLFTASLAACDPYSSRPLIDAKAAVDLPKGSDIGSQDAKARDFGSQDRPSTETAPTDLMAPDLAVTDGPASSCTVTITYSASGSPSKVEVFGSWDNWAQGTAMTASSGAYTVAIANLTNGATYQYKFVVDSAWQNCPTSPNTGSPYYNCLLTVVC